MTPILAFARRHWPLVLIVLIALVIMASLAFAHGPGSGGSGGSGSGGSGGGSASGASAGGGAGGAGGGGGSAAGSSAGDSGSGAGDGGMAPHLQYGAKTARPLGRGATGTLFLTPRQVQTWDAFRACAPSGAMLERLNPDGSFSFSTGESTATATRVRACMGKRGYRFQ